MKIAIVCESATGNTAQLAEALRFHFRSQEVTTFGPKEQRVGTAGVIFAGSWTNQGDCTENMAAFLEGLEGKNLFLFGTCGYGGDQAYFEMIYRRFAAHVKPSNHILGHFICQGRMGVEVIRRYESMLEANPGNERWIACIENYHQAMTHPSPEDLIALCSAADQALMKR